MKKNLQSYVTFVTRGCILNVINFFFFDFQHVNAAIVIPDISFWKPQ